MQRSEYHCPQKANKDFPFIFLSHKWHRTRSRSTSLLQALGLDVRHLSALVLLSRSFSFSLCWRSFSLFFAHLDGMISPEWYHDVMISLCSLFFFSLFVSVLASYKCVRDSNTHRSSYDRSPVHSAPDHLFLLLSFVSRSFLLSNKRFRGLAPYNHQYEWLTSEYSELYLLPEGSVFYLLKIQIVVSKGHLILS